MPKVATKPKEYYGKWKTTGRQKLPEGQRTYIVEIICPFCGKKIWRNKSSIVNRQPHSCGCVKPQKKEIKKRRTPPPVGTKYGMLTYTGNTKVINNKTHIEVECECKTRYYIQLYHFGRVKSCIKCSYKNRDYSKNKKTNLTQKELLIKDYTTFCKRKGLKINFNKNTIENRKFKINRKNRLVWEDTDEDIMLYYANKLREEKHYSAGTNDYVTHTEGSRFRRL